MSFLYDLSRHKFVWAGSHSLTAAAPSPAQVRRVASSMASPVRSSGRDAGAHAYTADTFVNRIVQLVAANGYADEAARSFGLCRDARDNEALHDFVHDAPRGRQRRTRLMTHAARGDVVVV